MKIVPYFLTKIVIDKFSAFSCKTVGVYCEGVCLECGLGHRLSDREKEEMRTVFW